MSVLATTGVNSLADDPRYPVIGAVALDVMAAIAGPPSTPDYKRAWNAASEIVAKAMFAGAADAELAAAA
jgi:hemoglobin-like flavoprotein